MVFLKIRVGRRPGVGGRTDASHILHLTRVGCTVYASFGD